MEKLKNKRGFTLVETLLAVAILSLMVVLPLSIASRTLSKITLGKDRFIATMLAREGVEYVRNIVDKNRIYNMNNPSSPIDWLTGVRGVTRVDVLPSNTNGQKTSSAWSPTVYADTSASGNTTGLYGMSTGTSVNCTPPTVSECWVATKYIRWVSITEPVSNREAVVGANTQWSNPTSGYTKTVTVTDQLLNW